MKKYNFNKLKWILASVFSLTVFFSCATSILKYAKVDQLSENFDFDKKVTVKELPPEVIPSETVSPKVILPNTVSSSDQTKASQYSKNNLTKASKNTTKNAANITKNNVKNSLKNRSEILLKASDKIKVREPSLENSEGFDGNRRPLVDPFLVGEKIVHSVTYFGKEAGKLTIETKPFVEVNNRKSYNFFLGLKTSSFFSLFYSVDDYVENFIDYENLIPHVFKMNVRESGKLANASSFFDNKKLKAQFWEKKYTEKNGEQQKNVSWDILPYSQNAFSGIFYMRIFKWDIGKEYSFRVADDEKNIIFKATALAKEKLETDAGEFNAIKLKASIVSRGALTQAGNFFIWISDDDRKIVLRMEAEIKIGKIVSEIIEYNSGK